MDAILAPWLARADALYPRWRYVLHGRHEGDLAAPRDRESVTLLTSDAGMSEIDRMFSDTSVLTAGEQLELREVLEILVLAVRIDGRKCVALACEGQRHLTLFNGDPFAMDERLCITIDAPLTPSSRKELCTAFFVDWKGAAASKAFKESHEALVRLLGRERLGRRFDLVLDLTLRSNHEEHETMALAAILHLLTSIDRTVFRVTQIKLNIKHSVFQGDELTELSRLIHGFRDDANVRIHSQICQDMDRTVDLSDWKTLLDLIARKTFPTTASISRASDKKKWDIMVVCGGPGLWNDPDCGRDRWSILTDARLVAACFSALAHAGDHVTSVCVHNPLEDKTSDMREPRDRDTRAQWLGYLLRAGVVDKLILNERMLTANDVRMISSIVEAPTRADCFRMLWKKYWRRSNEELHSEEVTYKHIENPESGLADAQEVLGLMNQDDDNEPDVEVFLVGYGQCSISRPFSEHVNVMQHATALVPERKAQLKSLRIQTHENDHGLFEVQGTATRRFSTSWL